MKTQAHQAIDFVAENERIRANLISYTSKRGSSNTVKEKTGIDKSWIQKFCDGRIQHAGLAKLTELNKFFAGKTA